MDSNNCRRATKLGEEDKDHDTFAVSVMKDGIIVGHMRNITGTSHTYSHMYKVTENW